MWAQRTWIRFLAYSPSFLHCISIMHPLALLFSVQPSHCHYIFVSFFLLGMFPFMWKCSWYLFGKEIRLIGYFGNRLVLSLAGRSGFWQERELNVQILKLSASRCMFKQENKEPSGTKLRALGVLSVRRGICFSSETNAQLHVWLSAPIPLPHLGNPVLLAAEKIPL